MRGGEVGAWSNRVIMSAFFVCHEGREGRGGGSRSTTLGGRGYAVLARSCLITRGVVSSEK